MKNATVNCRISLSKRLRALLGPTGSITLVASNLNGGKGTATLSLASEVDMDVKTLIENGETSIMITPLDATENNMETAGNVSTIFATIPPKGAETQESVISQIAAVHPPERYEVAQAVVQQVPTPQPFQETTNPSYQEYVGNVETLMELVSVAKHKDAGIDLGRIDDPREFARMSQEKEMAESIGVPAWIVTDNCGAITINDLQISLTKFMPLDIGKLSASKLAASSDLRALLKAGYVKFISPNQAEEFAQKAMEAVDGAGYGYEVYSSPEEAAGAIEQKGMSTAMIGGGSQMEITADSGFITEEEQMINLTQIPADHDNPVSVSNGTIRTQHGNGGGGGGGAQNMGFTTRRPDQYVAKGYVPAAPRGSTTERLAGRTGTQDHTGVTRLHE